jgi:hypothetical protein
MATRNGQICITHYSCQKDTVEQWSALSTMFVKECTADDETDYISLKDGKGRPNNNKIECHFKIHVQHARTLHMFINFY